MKDLTDEDQFSALLRRAEPPVPPFSNQVVLEALVAKRNGNSSTVRSKNDVASDKSNRVLAVVVSLLAIVIVVVGLPRAGQTPDTNTLAEYQAVKEESDRLADQLQRLKAIDDSFVVQVSTTDVRASESLWMLIQEYETNSPTCKSQAEMIVSLYAATPAARRCRKMFPDL